MVPGVLRSVAHQRQPIILRGIQVFKYHRSLYDLRERWLVGR